MQGDDRPSFVCPECGEASAVAPSVREGLVEAGCVFCGVPVSRWAFGVS